MWYVIFMFSCALAGGAHYIMNFISQLKVITIKILPVASYKRVVIPFLLLLKRPSVALKTLRDQIFCFVLFHTDAWH